MPNLEQLKTLNTALETLVEKQKYHKIETFFPDTGEYCRANYPKQMDFIEKSNFHSIMGLLGANGSGKTTLGSIFTYFHASGKYSKWWNGYRFKMGPIHCWVSGVGTKQLSAIQEILFGSMNDPGTGIIPREDLLDERGHLTTWAMPGVAQCFGGCYIKHYNQFNKQDGYSKIEFKTYEQGWEQYQGATRQWIWLDEEPTDAKIYSECLARTRGVQGKMGRILCTFTPLNGWSSVYLSFLPEGKLPPHGINTDNPEKFTMIIDDNQPHLTEQWKASMLEEWKRTDPLNIEARKKGIAAMGSGKIYPIEEEFFIIKRKPIPDYFPRAYGLDFSTTVGKTACVWVAEDPVTNIKYVYAEYKRTGVHDSVHVLAIQAKGKWIPGICDPRSGRRDGGELRSDYYKNLGLNLTSGESNPVAGISMILNDLQMGQLKIMEDCVDIISEIRTYRWDSKNISKPADKQDDHLLDSLRYVYSKFDIVAKVEEDDWDRPNYYEKKLNQFRDDLTGY